MKLRLLGWRSEGLRSADLEIKLDSEGRTPRVSLVQMPTGTGKTTTLTCLRSALSGEAQTWEAEDVARFAPPGSNDGRGEFEALLQLDGRPLTLSMTFDFSHGKVYYATTFGRGRNEKYDPPPGLRRFLTPHFVRLLIFDGELPQELLDHRKARAEDAIEAFFQTYLLRDMEETIDGIWKRATEDKTATMDKGLTRRRNRVQELEDKIRQLRVAEHRALTEQAELIREVAELEADERKYIQGTKVLREQREELEEEMRSAAARLEVELRELMGSLRLPHRAYHGFGTALGTLRDRLDRLRLPESTSAEFFRELAQEEHCICGRPLNVEMRRTILERANDYMGVDTFGVINNLKSDIATFEAAVPSEDTTALAEGVRALAHKHDQAKSSIDGLSRQLVERGDKELAALRNRLQVKSERLKTLAPLLDELGREPRPTDDDRTVCIDWWSAQLAEAESALSEITQTLTLRRHRDILVKILEGAREIASRRISSAIVSEMNNRLRELLPGHGIEVKGLNRSLILDRQKGASQGQTLTVGYSFLTTLFGRGKHEFPFLVDAPVTALDSRVRREVGRVIPKVCHQFVALVLDTEREGFVAPLARASGDDVLYLTAFEDSPRNESLVKDLPQHGVTRKGSAVVVEGKDYFERASFPPAASGRKGE